MDPAKKRCLRTRRPSDSSESEGEKTNDSNELVQQEDSTHVVEAIRELQKVRKRPPGISLSALSTGKAAPEETIIVSDPFKLKTGGLVEIRNAIMSKKTEEEDDVEARLAKTFATETNKRDEDAEMIKYIEEEIARRKGLRRTPSPESNAGADLLRDVPEYLRPVIGQQKEDMLSNQMLCGIPEVDLGVDAKMRNIEATEEAKQTLLKHRFNRGYGMASDGLAPTNVAVNFVQHSRWNSHNATTTFSSGDYTRDLLNIASKANPHKTDIVQQQTTGLDAERERLGAERSTDSLVLQRFKSHMRGRKRR
ncbi:hepatocellular carcinoma-associated antigen 59 [Opisthorchis viverrini]|uniref:Hepatocellular carcinoma-associated antigen 59 n=1 Tax=Opisthorchis viverrini TaxID=6198 RepID=A0A1S8WH03_OPIVI|nr:hepatocellular carcinoma-associated antigen 59 [Opisthorchis viverrini]